MMRHNGKFYRIFLLGMAAVSLLSLSAATFARYVSPEQVVVEKIIAPETFLAESDVLLEGGAEYQLWQPSTAIPVTLYNHEGNNRCSAMDVSYTVTAVGYMNEDGTGGSVPCVIRRTDGTTGQGTLTGTLPGGIAREAAFTVEPEGMDYASLQKIVVTADCAPYERILTAVFHINSQENPVYEIIDTPGEMTARLILRGGSKLSQCRISWNGSFYPDRTNSLVHQILGDAAADGMTFDLTAAESVEILFFKRDSLADYSREMQKIINGEIVLGTPSR